MRPPWLSILACIAAVSPQLADNDRPDVAHPLIVLEIQWPFNTNGTFDAPNFALYDDGVTIFLMDDSRTRYPDYASVTLSNAEISELLSLAHADGFSALDSTYDTAPMMTDQPVTIIRVWSGDRQKAVAVRGSAQHGPPPFAALFRRLKGFTHPTARIWLPDSVEVALFRVDSGCAHFIPVPWPAALPRPQVLSDARMVRFALAPTYLRALEQLREDYDNYDCTPIAIDHTYWQLGYDYPFPAEATWRHP